MVEIKLTDENVSDKVNAGRLKEQIESTFEELRDAKDNLKTEIINNISVADTIETLQKAQKLFEDKNNFKELFSETSKESVKWAGFTLALQIALKSLSYDPWIIDGMYGPQTKEAVRAFQATEKWLTQDGIAGRDTLEKLLAKLGAPVVSENSDSTNNSTDTSKDEVLTYKRVFAPDFLDGNANNNKYTGIDRYEMYNGIVIDKNKYDKRINTYGRVYSNGIKIGEAVNILVNYHTSSYRVTKGTGISREKMLENIINENDPVINAYILYAAMKRAVWEKYRIMKKFINNHTMNWDQISIVFGTIDGKNLFQRLSGNLDIKLLQKFKDSQKMK